MRFLELLTPSNTSKVQKLGDLGAIGFGTGVTDKNKTKTPHYEMLKGIEMYESNSIVNSGVNQLSLFIIPNKKMKVWSSDQNSLKWAQEWFDLRKNMIEEIRNFWITGAITGCKYLERHYEGSKLDNISCLNDSSRVYYNPNHRPDGSDAYIYELRWGTKNFTYKGKVRQPGYYNVPYFKNANYTMHRVYGIPISNKELVSCLTGWSRDNLYGRSPLASSIDDNNIMTEILSTWDTVTKTRQLDRKILSVDSVEAGAKFTEEKMSEIASQIEDSDKSFTLLNFPLKTATTDINVSGNYDLMEGVYDIARRKIMMSLLPTYLTPWNDSGTTMGAEASMPPFLQRIKTEQNSLINFLNGAIIDELRNINPSLADDLTIVFDEPQIMPDENYIRKVTDLVREEIITPQQAREMLSQIGVLDADIFEDDEGDKEPSQSQPTPDSPNKDNDVNDDNNDNNNDDKESLSEGNPQGYSEAFAVKKTVFDTFKRKFRQLTDKKVDTSKWKKTDMHKVVGGKQPRVVEAPEQWLLFDGIRMVQSLDKYVVSKDAMRRVFDGYVQKLEELQDEFLDDETPEDKLVKDFKAEVEKELEDRLKQLTALIDKSSRQTENFNEAFLSQSIFPKIDNLFKGFNTKMNSTITRITNKLGVNVIDDTDTNVEPSTKFKKMVDDRKKMVRDSLKSQIGETKDKMVTDIKHQLRQGIMAGKSVKDIKADVRKSFDYDKKVDYKFDRIIHTTTRQSAMLLKLRKWQDAGFETYVWQTKEDERVRENHRSKNQKVFKIKDALDGKMIFPGGSLKPGEVNINCRCTAYPYD